MDGTRNAWKTWPSCPPQHRGRRRGDDTVTLATQLTDFLVLRLRTGVNATLLLVRRSACQKSSARRCTVFVAVPSRTIRNRTAGPALAFPVHKWLFPPRARACHASGIGNLLLSRSKKLLRYSLPAKIYYTVNSLCRVPLLTHFENLEPPPPSAIFRLQCRLRLLLLAHRRSINQNDPSSMIHACRGRPAIENYLFGGCASRH
jgi:hypothetical protein